MRRPAGPSVLDDPVGESLRGHHVHLARRLGGAIAYRPGVATFAAVPVDPTGQDWADLAVLLGPDAFADLFSSPAVPPADWAPVFTLDGFQMVADEEPDHGSGADPGVPGAGPDVVELGPSDVPEMLALAARTRPGPFWPETPLLGRYVGVRQDGVLVAMAGERLRPPGWTEISAVCTAPEARGRGLAARVVRDVAAHVVARGERPFLHVAADNAPAIGLYRRLGFRTRRGVVFRGYRTPAG